MGRCVAQITLRPSVRVGRILRAMETPRTPLVDAVRAARARRPRPMQIPGHKNRYVHEDTTAIGHEFLHDIIRDDVALQGGADDNAFTHGFAEQAEALYARAIGAAHTRFLVNGSSQGNIAALLAVAEPGRPVAVDRTSHRSALAGLQMSGGLPEWVFPEIHPEFGLPTGVRPEALAGLSANVSGVFVTAPAYVGTISDIQALAAVTDAMGVPLIIDQAWGAHLDFLSGTHGGAIRRGADVVVTSIHKTLLGYSQSATVSCGGRYVDAKRLDRAVDLTMTTSPSATLMASIDATRATMERYGAEALARAIAATAAAKARLRTIPGLVVIDEAEIGSAVDPLKITLWLPRTGVMGSELAADLWQLGHGVESADGDTIAMTVTVVDDAAFLLEVADKIAHIIERRRGEARTPMPAQLWQIRPEVVVAPREALFAPRRRVSMREAIGQVSAEQFVPYPPGVPLLAPGERVTAEIVEAIAVAGTVGRVSYCSDRSLQTIEILN